MSAQGSKQTASTSIVSSGNPIAQRIVTAARRHYFAHGFRGVTMDDLAAELGMSKKTLYGSFPSKLDLLRAVLLDKFRSVEADLDRVMSSSKDVLDALRKLLTCMQQHTEEIQPPFVRDIRREAPEMFQVVQTQRRKLIQHYFGKIFEDGRKAGIIRKDVSSRLMIEMLVGVTEAIMNPIKMAELRLTPASGYVNITKVILEGLLTEKGRSK
jgi:TetR/AcrR family transcriptional regulator, cholesterol catabolism regulator